ncbi:FkbM family methyltransferase [Capilliphycus salinus ALCB114379]|uniref:FkbM family methyltransferase n=1 Tax=Capilliphycus salinus TaxID=2768948 RepID=UPI0039A59BAB
MRVEPCCLALLKMILPEIDSQREGICFDIGVGTFAFYCELFAQLKFTTVAVEPLPVPKLYKLCKRYPITLIESCLSDRNGTQTLYRGKFANLINSNFSSLSPNWFGSSASIQEVKTLDLLALFSSVNAQKITCFKLDIEGWESVIIKQFLDLPEHLLPKVVMFEYGGGSRRFSGTKGWSSPFLEGTMKSLHTLQDCGYGFSIMIDYAAKTQPKIFDLRSLSLDENTLFYPNAVYGNIISFYNCFYSETAVNQICQSYTGNIIHWFVEKFLLS